MLGGCAGAEELGFVLVLRDYDHLLTAAAAETAVRANVSQSLVGHRVALAIRLGNGNHTAKLVSFADGRWVPHPPDGATAHCASVGISSVHGKGHPWVP